MATTNRNRNHYRSEFPLVGVYRNFLKYLVLPMLTEDLSRLRMARPDVALFYIHRIYDYAQVLRISCHLCIDVLYR